MGWLGNQSQVALLGHMESSEGQGKRLAEEVEAKPREGTCVSRAWDVEMGEEPLSSISFNHVYFLLCGFPGHSVLSTEWGTVRIYEKTERPWGSTKPAERGGVSATP